MKKIILILLLLLFAVPLAAQQFGQVGTSGAQILKISFDPRASGLGNAAASVVNNAAAVYTNVAGIEGIQKADLAFTYVPWFAGIDMVSLSAAYRWGDIGVVGVQASGFSSQEEITTIEMENGTGQTYSIQNVVVGLSFARHITDKLVVGVQGKYIREAYFDHSTSGLAFDIGTNYDLGFVGSRLAMSLQNFGSDLAPLQGNYQDYSDGNVSKGPNDNVEHYCLGSEILLYDFLAVRGGLKLNYDDESFAAGVGFKGDKFLGQNVRFDYSFEKFKILPSVQRISIGIAF